MFSKIKDFIIAKPKVYDLINAIRPIRDPVEIWVDNYSSKKPGLKFVQIGANDGLRWDPFRRFIIRDKWQGVFVEPVPVTFKMLEKNYSYLEDRKYKFVNAAISTSGDKELTFWTFREEFLITLPIERQMYYLRKASFEKKNVKYSIGVDEIAEKNIIGSKVQCINIHELVEKYIPDQHVDLLIIDAEGYDAKIIKSINFDKFAPSALIFESHSIGSEKSELYHLLESNHYQIIELEGDTAAIRST
jgi:FkbM family methyltransferase